KWLWRRRSGASGCVHRNPQDLHGPQGQCDCRRYLRRAVSAARGRASAALSGDATPLPGRQGRPGNPLRVMRLRERARLGAVPSLPDFGASMTPLVSIDNVDMRYGGPEGTLAVSGLNLKINRGEFIAVVGPSGCGKSTLMKLATGLHIPQSGVVIVGNEQVTKPVSIVGMAFQNPTMFPWRTTLENILLPLEIVERHRHRLRRH